MPKKPYRSTIADSPSIVKEADPRPYGRPKRKTSAGRCGVTVAEVKRRIKSPVKRSKRDIAWALEIVGIGAGPTDLSKRAREYFSRGK